MSNTNFNRFLDLPFTIKHMMIFNSEGISFNFEWVDRLIRYFDSETAAQAVNYTVNIYIEGVLYSGELEVRRDGTHAIRLAH